MPLKYRVGVMLGLLGQLRKCEIAGLDWEDVDFEHRMLHVRRSATYVQGIGVVIKEPKTSSGRRTIALPADLLETMKALKREQTVDRLQLGETWEDSCAMFVAWNGSRKHPDTIGKWFVERKVAPPHPIGWIDYADRSSGYLYSNGSISKKAR